jgi:hypothetical protein
MVLRRSNCTEPADRTSPVIPPPGVRGDAVAQQADNSPVAKSICTN